MLLFSCWVWSRLGLVVVPVVVPASCCFWSLCRFFTFPCSGSAHGQRSLCPQRERERKGVESELERLVQSWSARKELRQMLATLPTIWPAAAVEVFPAALTQRYAWPEPKIKKKYMAALRYAEQPTASLLRACLLFAGTLSPSRAANQRCGCWAFAGWCTRTSCRRR